MRRAVAWLVLLACAGGCAGQYYYSQPTHNPYGRGYDGTACSPPYGYRHNPCGPSTLINRETVPACEYVWGPNVCLFTDTFLTNQTEYQYKESCDWVYSHAYYRWIKQCSYICQPTYECTDIVQVVERTYEQCCPGFVPRTPKGHSYYNQYYHYAYYTPVSSGPEGCPVACGDTLLECLQIQGLDEFISYLNQTNYFDLLNTSGSQLTVFAPTNAAFQQAQAMGLPLPTNAIINISMIVGNHLVRGNITHQDLEKTGVRIYTNVEGLLLHRVSVSFDDYSYVSYNPGYSYYGGPQTSLKTTIVPFINGAEVVVEDACKTENGSLQIINMVLMPSNITIAEILRLDPDFSMFVDALDSVNLLQFLENPSVSRTVFAVQDSAFNGVFPSDLRTCLSMYMRRPYNDIWLYHIAPEAHYNSSLALHNFFYTLLLQFIRVDVADNGTIFLGPDRVRIIPPSIPARNGVIHVVENVLIPPDFNYGMCEQFVPTTQPPTPTPTEPMNVTSPTEPIMNMTSPEVASPSALASPAPTSLTPVDPVGAPGQFNPFPPGP